jgi:DNA-binding transcriptional MerR regulator
MAWCRSWSSRAARAWRPLRSATTSGSACCHPPRAAGQRRHYPPSTAERVALIRLYQDAGFTLAEIRRLLAATTRGRPAWSRLAGRKSAELDARIAHAQRAKKLIEHALNCPHRDLLACPNFRAALEEHLERPR